MKAQGNALGCSVFCMFFALKGQFNRQVVRLFRPFRAWSICRCQTQGVALGFLVPAFQAEERRLNVSNRSTGKLS